MVALVGALINAQKTHNNLSNGRPNSGLESVLEGGRSIALEGAS